MPSELDRGAIFVTGMRRCIVEVAPPRLDHDAGFCVRAEPLDTQAFVTKSAIEALVGAVLPGLPEIDERRADPRFGSPCRIAWLTNSGPLSEGSGQNRGHYAASSTGRSSGGLL